MPLREKKSKKNSSEEKMIKKFEKSSNLNLNIEAVMASERMLKSL